ncbi:MAG: Flp family type IVb pilin [Zavarzinia sp.]|nr:Flp family type IVb pilin [Zavarzinia sp.]
MSDDLLLEECRAIEHENRDFGDERGATALEYAFIAGLISIAAAGILLVIGEDVAGYFQSFADLFP